MIQLAFLLITGWQGEVQALSQIPVSAGSRLEEDLRGQSTLYGRHLTYIQLKQLGVPVVRNRMYQLVRELDPGGVARRMFARQNVPHGDY